VGGAFIIKDVEDFIVGYSYKNVSTKAIEVIGTINFRRVK
jgi:hypothetical protein